MNVRKNSNVLDVLNWIVEPANIEHRIDRYREVVLAHPWYEEMLKEAFYPRYDHHILVNHMDESSVEKLKHYPELNAETFWKRYYVWLSDDNTKMYGDNKANQMIGAFEFLTESDAKFFWNFLKKRWVGPRRINKAFLNRVGIRRDEENV